MVTRLRDSNDFANQRWGLLFDATKGGHVNHGPFAILGESYSSFQMDMIIRPTDPDQGTAGYFTSPGYGGVHFPALLGYTSSAGKFAITGNIYNPAAPGSPISFSTLTKYNVNEDHHVLVLWDGSVLVLYVNGVAEFAVPHVYATLDIPANTDTILFVGGSDHNKPTGIIRWLRIFMNQIPVAYSSYAPFRTTLFPRSSYYVGSTVYNANFLADYSRPWGDVIPDYSVGLDGVKHPGVRTKGASNGNFQSSFPLVVFTTEEEDLPQWVYAEITPPTAAAVPSVPGGRKSYDDFSDRENSPFWSDVDGLGSTQGGSAGVQPWVTAAGAYCISGGCAVGKLPASTNLAITEIGSQTQDITITGTGPKRDIYARYVDGSNMVNGTFYESGGLLYWVIQKQVAGVWTTIVSGNSPGAASAPSVARLNISGTSVELYADGVLKASGTDGSMPTGTKAGFNLTSQDLTRVTLWDVV